MPDPAPAIPVAASAVLGQAQRELILGRASIIAATCDATLAPHLMRSVGCRLSAGGDRVSVLLSRSGSERLLADVAANGRIAVVFSQPTTARTLQLKGSDAVVEPCRPGDTEIARAYTERMVVEISALGFDAAMVRGMFAAAVGELVVLSFTPTSVFEQTPGPRAGEPLMAGDGQG